MARILRIQGIAPQGQGHSFRSAAHALAVKAAPYETRAFLLWATTAAGFAGTTAVRRCPASANLWSWVYVIVIALTLLTLLLDHHAWEERNGAEEDRADHDWAIARDRALPLRAPAMARIDTTDPPGGKFTAERGS
jgi:hypothetical protein